MRLDALTLTTVALVALPPVVAIGFLVGEHWHPVSDLAIEVLGIRDVGGRHTPLVGVQSRFGYFHPGPTLFWVLAPFEWLFGTTGILMGTALLNAAALGASVLVARRRGGAPAAVAVGLVAALLCRGLGPQLLIEPWNPWVVVLPFLLYVLLAWSVADRDWPALAWLVGIGSFVVQAHVGYAPLVIGLGAVACGLGALGARSVAPYDAQLEPDDQNASRHSAQRWIAMAAMVAAFLWAAPVIQQLTGSPGNLGEIVDAFRHPDSEPVGWEGAFGIMGRQLLPLPPFVTGDEIDANGLLARSSTLPAIGVLLTSAALGALAWRRGGRSAGHLALLAAAAAVLGVIATSRITGLPIPYLVRWAWVVAGIVWLSIAVSAWSLLREGRAARVAVLAALVPIAIVSLATAWRAVEVAPPQHRLSNATGSLGEQAAAKLEPDHLFLVTWIDAKALGATGIGMYAELEDRGVPVRVPKRLGHAFGAWRTVGRADMDGVLTVVAGADLDAGWVPPARARTIAHFDPLNPTERSRFQRLEQQVRSQIRALKGEYVEVDAADRRERLVARGADPGIVSELWRLAENGDRYRLYLVPA